MRGNGLSRGLDDEIELERVQMLSIRRADLPCNRHELFISKELFCDGIPFPHLIRMDLNPVSLAQGRKSRGISLWALENYSSRSKRYAPNERRRD